MRSFLRTFLGRKLNLSLPRPLLYHSSSEGLRSKERKGWWQNSWDSPGGTSSPSFCCCNSDGLNMPQCFLIVRIRIILDSQGWLTVTVPFCHAVEKAYQSTSKNDAGLGKFSDSFKSNNFRNFGDLYVIIKCDTPSNWWKYTNRPNKELRTALFFRLPHQDFKAEKTLFYYQRAIFKKRKERCFLLLRTWNS